jgi:hypothetical protein
MLSPRLRASTVSVANPMRNELAESPLKLTTVDNAPLHGFSHGCGYERDRAQFPLELAVSNEGAAWLRACICESMSAPASRRTAGLVYVPSFTSIALKLSGG